MNSKHTQRHAKAQRFADSLFGGSAAAICREDIEALKTNVQSLGGQASDSLKLQVAQLDYTFNILQKLKEAQSRVAALEEEINALEEKNHMNTTAAIKLQ